MGLGINAGPRLARIDSKAFLLPNGIFSPSHIKHNRMLFGNTVLLPCSALSSGQGFYIAPRGTVGGLEYRPVIVLLPAVKVNSTV